MRVSRRAFLASMAAAAAVRAENLAPTPVRDLVVREEAEQPARGASSRRFVLLVPTHLGPNERVPRVVLLHGLAETADARMGAYAWLERYGLGDAYDRLRRPPIRRTRKEAYWTDARLAEVNTELALRPFRGMAFACPFMPNPYKAPSVSAALDELGNRLVTDVVPRAQANAPVMTDAAKTALGGCSLGGFAGLEVFVRRAEAFAAFAGVQSAIGEASAQRYAERIAGTLARVGPRKLLLESSSGDPYRAATERLAKELAARKIDSTLRVPPGPHDQPWLREVGTLEMLLWLDRALA